MVDARLVGDDVEVAQDRHTTAIDERVEEPQLDVLMILDRRDDLLRFVIAEGILVVDQQSHANPTIGGVQDRLLDQLAGVVLGKDVVLDVE